VKRDVAIDEIRAVRHRISERFDHNTRALLDHYREMEAKYEKRMLREFVPREAEKKSGPPGGLPPASSG
jgi:hypothetical protein